MLDHFTLANQPGYDFESFGMKAPDELIAVETEDLPVRDDKGTARVRR